MQSINIYEKGISYLGAVLSVYSENCAYLVLFILGIVYVMVKGSERDKEIFIPSAVLLMVTVYNPIVAYLVNRFFDINNEYYRLFWIAPVVILVAYIAADIIEGNEESCPKKNSPKDNRHGNAKIVSAILVALILIFAGNFVYSGGYNKAENIYQIPDELIEISEIIHSDALQEYPKVFFEYEYNMQIRQYNPKIRLTIDREDYLRAVAEDYPDDMIYNADYPQYCLLACLLRGQEVDADTIKNALENSKTEYVVLSKGNNQEKILKEIGLDLVATTDNHTVYRYSVEEPYIYELVDYTDAEHDFSYRLLK